MFPVSLWMRKLMYARRALVLLAFTVVLAGCGTDDSSTGAGSPGNGAATCVPGEMPLADGRCQPAGLPPDMPCPPGEMRLDTGACQPAGLPPDMPCPPGETPLDDGRCQPAGVPPEACGEGFAPDGRGGCDAILPEGVCLPGQMAVPGDTACHEVAPCGDGDYGTIPVDATTQFVNGAYGPDDSDGTQARPWKRIQDGIDHALSRAIVAVAAGSYVEDLEIRSRPVRLWGRCPSLVEVVGTGATRQALAILGAGASSSEVRSLAIKGPTIGLRTGGADNILAEHVWIHDTAGQGVHTESTSSQTSVTVRASLIERATDAGVVVFGSAMGIEATVIRAVESSTDDGFGFGIAVQDSPHERATLRLRSSLLEQNHGSSVAIISSDAVLDATVIRTTQPSRDGRYGHGIDIIGSDENRANLMLRASVLDHNHDMGVVVTGSHATIEATVVRDTLTNRDGSAGCGVIARGDPTTDSRSELSLRTSLLERNHSTSVCVIDSDATFEATVVRGTQPNSDGTLGRGVEISGTAATHAPARATLRAVLLEQNHDAGLLVGGSDATIEATVVRGNGSSSDGTAGGYGIAVQNEPETQQRANVTLRTSLLEDNRGGGMLVIGSDATVETSVVRASLPYSDGWGGDGILVEHDETTHQRATLTMRASVLEQNHRRGLCIIGSDATAEATIVRDTRPGLGGRGDGIAIIGVDDGSIAPEPSTLTLRDALVERNHETGIIIQSAHAEIESTVVRNTQPLDDGTRGIGIIVQGHGLTIESIPTERKRGTLTLRTSLIEQNHGVGVLALDSDATIDTTVVRGTRPGRDEAGGDGIMVASYDEPATVSVASAVVEDNARAGISNFGAAAVVVSSTLRCNRFHLAGEDAAEGQAFTFGGSGGNICGCDAPEPTCRVVSATLSPPEPISPTDP